MDVAATESLADLYRREQAAGRCLNAEQLAAVAVSHLYAFGYRRADGPLPRWNEPVLQLPNPQ